MKERLKEYENRKEDILNYQAQWNNLQNDISDIDNRRYDEFEKNRDDNELNLLDKIMKKHLIKGEIFQNGVIEYDFGIGIRWSVDMCYDYYQNKVKEDKIEIKQKKREEIINTKEIDKLI